jgi:hypothetical protein
MLRHECRLGGLEATSRTALRHSDDADVSRIVKAIEEIS